MKAHRAAVLAAGTTMLALVSGPAAAQVDPSIAVNILRECSRIDEPTARLACYDNNIRQVGGTARSSVPGHMARPAGGSSPLAGDPVRGFGGESIRGSDRGYAAPVAPSVRRITPRVQAAVEREPGKYLVTLNDGQQWEFADTAGLQYRAPAPGQTIEIDRAAMGSYLMRVDGQQAIRVRRVR